MSLLPIETVMKDQMPKIFNNSYYNIIFNLQPNEGTDSVRRKIKNTFFFIGSFDVEIPPKILAEKVVLGSDESLPLYCKFYLGADSLYEIYPIDHGLKMKSMLNLSVKKRKCCDIYRKCYFSCCCKLLMILLIIMMIMIIRKLTKSKAKINPRSF